MMKVTTTIFISLFFLIAEGYAQSGDKEPVRSKINRYLQEGVSNGFSGAILISEKGEILLNEGYGLANKDGQIPNSSKTIFDIGSNTKQFTGAAILKLVELGQLNVTDSLYRFFDNLPVDKRNITIHQLLTHSAGLIESIGRDFDHIPREEFFARVFASELRLEPGLKYEYSNIGYSVLARIIELTSGKSYERFLNEHLFIPAGMYQTGYLLPKWDTTLLARGYNRNVLDIGSTAIRYQEDGKVSWHLKGNGGINSSQDDMYKWYEALVENKVISDVLLEKYTTSYIGNDSGTYGYGYGWGITTSDRGTKRISHNGSNGAFAHTIIWLPVEDVIIIYATNAGSPVTERLGHEVEKMFFDHSYEPQPIRKNPYFFIIDFIGHNSVSESDRLLDSIKEEYPSMLETPESLNRLGYIVLRSEENLEWAVEIFKLNTQLFENEGNVWDSLGDGYLANGQREEAIKNFKRAIELNNEDTRDKLKELLSKE